MAQDPPAIESSQTGSPQPADKLVIASQMTHAKLLALIAERNPLIARTIRPRGRA